MIFIGIDLHTNCFNCCYMFDSGKMLRKSFNFTIVSLEAFFKTLTHSCYVMIEASTGTFSFVDKIKDKVKEVFVANTHKLKLISMVKKKTDKIDAEKLAIYLKMQLLSSEELIEPVYIPDHTIRDLRSLYKSYGFFKKEKAAIKNRVHSLLKQNLYSMPGLNFSDLETRKAILNLNLSEGFKFQLEVFFKEYDQRVNVLNEIKYKIFIVGSKYMKEIEILTSMKGISVFTALALIADIASIKRFSNSKKLASYLRSTPGVDNSNETTKTLKTNKAGRKLSIELILQSMNHIRNSSQKLDSWYLKLSESKKAGKSRIALSRKTFTIIFQMLKNEEYYWYRDIKKHENKMNDYKNFLKKRA